MYIFFQGLGLQGNHEGISGLATDTIGINCL